MQIQIQLIAITLVKLLTFTTFVFSQTSYIHDICDTINIPSGSPLYALLRVNAGTIK